MQEDNKFSSVIKKEETAFYSVLGIIMLVQAPHLAVVFSELSDLPDPFHYLHGAVFAISLDLGVLFFAVRGKVPQTIGFMVISAIVTAKYYYEDILNGDIFNAVTVTLISIAPALLVYLVADELNVKKESIESKVISMKSQGHTYDEISDVLKIGRTRISDILKKHKEES